jgi:hypothetical protein
LRGVQLQSRGHPTQGLSHEYLPLVPGLRPATTHLLLLSLQEVLEQGCAFLLLPLLLGKKVGNGGAQGGGAEVTTDMTGPEQGRV